MVILAGSVSRWLFYDQDGVTCELHGRIETMGLSLIRVEP